MGYVARLLNSRKPWLKLSIYLEENTNKMTRVKKLINNRVGIVLSYVTSAILKLFLKKLGKVRRNLSDWPK